MNNIGKNAAVAVNGETVQAECGQRLASLLQMEFPCGGHGKCGKCKVIAEGNLSPMGDSERRHLSEEEILRGIRLACQAEVRGDCRVFFGREPEKKQIVTEGKMPSFEPDPSFSQTGFAVDIGTTTLAARLYAANGALLAEASALNPQSAWGADVISRIEAEMSGKGQIIAAATAKALDALIGELAKAGNIPVDRIDGGVITGNTVMLHLLTGTATEPLSRAPFQARELFGKLTTAGELGMASLRPGTEICLPPCVSAFVGADIVCALLSVELMKHTGPAMLADIGTNGEIVLWESGRLTACSTAAGPAFEGVGISAGMNACEGAVDRVEAEPDGGLRAHVIGGGPAKGICGSGLIDAVACLLENDTLDPSGYLEEEPVQITPSVVLTQRDIRMVQLAKSAISSGMKTLLRLAGIPAKDISALYIAGGFGQYLSLENAGRIGLIPSELIRSAGAVGNAALSGASLLLLSKGLRVKAEALARQTSVIELSSNPVFAEEYMEGMIF